ncbi:MAG: sulfite exporter TauE/SafE family protein [Magnetospirillum sp.]|nr:sulfite exporter TauE/SafE family protein [Magnetospirillum sp.]
MPRLDAARNLPLAAAPDIAMTPFVLTGFAVLVVCTSTLSGIFGMAGGVILIGVLLSFMPVPAAMALHGATQIAANLSRAFMWRRHIRTATALFYVAGALGAVLLWSLFLYVPERAHAFVALGLIPFAVRLVPDAWQGRPENRLDAVLYGAICMTAILMTGVAGPMLDAFFLRGKFDRREIVATKSAVQSFGHFAKLVYFGALIDDVVFEEPHVLAVAIAMAVLGTSLGGLVLERMKDVAFRRWADGIVNAVSLWYLGYGLYLLFVKA